MKQVKQKGGKKFTHLCKYLFFWGNGKLFFANVLPKMSNFDFPKKVLEKDFCD